MKKLFVCLSFTCLVFLVNAQNNNDITGLYNINFSHDPQGFCKMCLLKDHRYIIVFFGGISSGTWKMVDDTIVGLTPSVHASHFAIYGRHNKDLGDSIRILFQGFEEGETFFSIGNIENEKSVMKRLFNRDPNCFTYPYLLKFKTMPGIISFAMKPHLMEDDSSQLPKICTFENKKNDNDFVAYHFEDAGDKGISYIVAHKDTLYFEGEGQSVKEPLPVDKEYNEIMQLLNIDMNPDIVYYNPLFNDGSNDNFNITDYTFNEQKGAYLKNSGYVMDEEYQQMPDAFNRMTIVYSFKRIPVIAIKRGNFTIDETPLFYVICKNDE